MEVRRIHFGLAASIPGSYHSMSTKCANWTSKWHLLECAKTPTGKSCCRKKQLLTRLDQAGREGAPGGHWRGCHSLPPPQMLVGEQQLCQGSSGPLSEHCTPEQPHCRDGNLSAGLWGSH